MVKNLLEDIVYIEPRTDLPIPEGMCKDCGKPEQTSEQTPPIIDTAVLSEKR